MNLINTLFLEAFKAFLENKTVEWQDNLETEQWEMLFQLAAKHKILPIVFQAVYDSPAARQMDPELLQLIKQKVKRQVIEQFVKTSSFLELYKHLEKQGLRPLVVKGIVCRELYPQPDYRSSGDEDMLIAPELFLTCHQAMLDFGMELSQGRELSEEEYVHALESYEVAYGKPGSLMYIELHKSLFPLESDSYVDFNNFFKDSIEQAIEIEVNGQRILTLNYTDHFFYLVCHAFKHFLHSGVGIRQISDIVMFANTYGSKIDWEKVLENCKSIRADGFAAALFDIGQKYLTFSPEKACYPEAWQRISMNGDALLEDLLSSGIYGDSSMSRKHSANITLDAVAADKLGKKRKGLIRTIFLPLDEMKGKSSYLHKYPWLLPVAWVERVWKYRKEQKKMGDNSAGESIKIGNQRVELMKLYGVIKEK